MDLEGFLKDREDFASEEEYISKRMEHYADLHSDTCNVEREYNNPKNFITRAIYKAKKRLYKLGFKEERSAYGKLFAAFDKLGLAHRKAGARLDYPEESLYRMISQQKDENIDVLIVGLSKFCYAHDDFVESKDLYEIFEGNKPELKIMPVAEAMVEFDKSSILKNVRAVAYVPTYDDCSNTVKIKPFVFQNF